jgi:hypothetical protein
MNIPRFNAEDLRAAFKRDKVLNKTQLLHECGCSAMTAWRLLHKEGYFTSYNYNAGYYTLAAIAQFDDHGLWTYRDIRFSQWGTLPKTIVGVVELSPWGMTSQELEHLLQVANVKPLLPKLICDGRLKRESLKGAFVYLPADQEKYEQQLHRRIEAIKPPILPEPQQIIALLVEMVQRPDKTPRQWARRLARRNIRMGIQDIKAVMEHYCLTVKKTLLRS